MGAPKESVVELAFNVPERRLANGRRNLQKRNITV